MRIATRSSLAGVNPKLQAEPQASNKSEEGESEVEIPPAVLSVAKPLKTATPKQAIDSPVATGQPLDQQDETRLKAMSLRDRLNLLETRAKAKTQHKPAQPTEEPNAESGQKIPPSKEPQTAKDPTPPTSAFKFGNTEQKAPKDMNAPQPAHTFAGKTPGGREEFTREHESASHALERGAQHEKRQKVGA